MKYSDIGNDNGEFQPDDYFEPSTSLAKHTHMWWYIFGILTLGVIALVIYYFTRKSDTPAPIPVPCPAGKIKSPCQDGEPCITPCGDNENYDCNAKKCVCITPCGEQCCPKGKTCKVVHVCE